MDLKCIYTYIVKKRERGGNYCWRYSGQAAGVELGGVAVPQAQWINSINAWRPWQSWVLHFVGSHTIQSQRFC
jgi:hypothetical protein